MFDFLFGWRKASQCKKLIRRVQCRLKLLKNKRCTIVRQLREAVAQLLKTGHEQSAFDRVEQLFKDESIVAVYDLLDHFCEFIIIRLSYIRKHKDCPNDITEAVSSLIFASARCGDLPELPVIRKLFGERYGQRFARVALELLPGNLVNSQIKENLSIKSVPDDVKCRLMDEIARSCLQPGPLALEYFPELQQQEQANKNTGDYRNEESQAQSSNLTEAETKIVYVDFSSDSKKLLIEPCLPYQGSDSTGTSAHSSPVLHSALNSEECPMHRKEGRRVESYTHLNSQYEFLMHRKEVGMAAESSSGSSCQLPKEMIYLDDIEEFKSPMSKDENCQDQRLFMFKSPVILTAEKLEDGSKEGCMEKYESRNEKAGSRNTRKNVKGAGKRDRRISFSRESRSVRDFESAIYHGESCTNSSTNSRRSHHRRKHQNKISFDESRKSYCAQKKLDKHCCVNRGMNYRTGKCGYDKKRSLCSCSCFNSEMVHECSFEHPCYFHVNEDQYDWESQKRRITTLEGFPAHDLKEEKLEHSICHCPCFCKGEPNSQEVEWELLPQKLASRFNKPNKKLAGEAERFDCSRVTSPWTQKETQLPYLKAITMLPERPNDYQADILRSNSFPFQKLSHLSNGSSACRHVHPKLPDYDQLAAKFMALKKVNLQYKSSQFRGREAACAEIDL